jgi:glucose-1-phosphate thymidylyltransferase
MSTWGIIPAAGTGSLMQPLAFAKELLPVGSRINGETEYPRAVSEYLIERMIAGGATKLCFVISPRRSDLIEYFGGRIGDADITYVVQPNAVGLCDALFRARPVISPDDHVLIGLPDTIWFPPDGFALLPNEGLSFLLFPVQQPQFFDAVVTDANDEVAEIQVKPAEPRSNWIWGAVKMDGPTYHALLELWSRPGRHDEHLGTLVNAYLAEGGRAVGIRAGLTYVDVGTPHGYREAIHLLTGHGAPTHSGTPSDLIAYTDGWHPLTAQGFGVAFPDHRLEIDRLPRSDR